MGLTRQPRRSARFRRFAFSAATPTTTGFSLAGAAGLPSAQFTGVGPFSFNISNIKSFAILPDTQQNNAPSLAISGQILIPLPGGNSQDQISVAANTGNPLFVDGAAPLGFDLNGGRISLTTAFTFLGANISVQNLTIDMEADGTIAFWGSASITSTPVNNDSCLEINASASFGDSLATAGLVISSNDTLEAFNLDFNGTFKLAGLEVDAIDFQASYSASLHQLGLSGTLSVSLEGYTFMAGLVPGPNGPGVVIDTQTGQAQFNGVEISVSGFNLGLFTIEDFDMTFTVGGPGDVSISANTTIELPGD